MILFRQQRYWDSEVAMVDPVWAWKRTGYLKRSCLQCVDTLPMLRKCGSVRCQLSGAKGQCCLEAKQACFMIRKRETTCETVPKRRPRYNHRRHVLNWPTHRYKCFTFTACNPPCVFAAPACCAAVSTRSFLVPNHFHLCLQQPKFCLVLALFVCAQFIAATMWTRIQLDEERLHDVSVLKFSSVFLAMYDTQWLATLATTFVPWAHIWGKKKLAFLCVKLNSGKL